MLDFALLFIRCVSNRYSPPLIFSLTFFFFQLYYILHVAAHIYIYIHMYIYIYYTVIVILPTSSASSSYTCYVYEIPCIYICLIFGIV